jgi:hypothetical protein
MPHVHEPAPGLSLALGCNGRGIALCTSLGQQIARRLQAGHEGTADFAYPVTRMRRIPLHGLQRFIAAGVAWYSLLDRLEARRAAWRRGAASVENTVSPLACGGSLMAMALKRPLLATVPAWAVPRGITSSMPGRICTWRSPSQAVPVPSTMYWISSDWAW